MVADGGEQTGHIAAVDEELGATARRMMTKQHQRFTLVMGQNVLGMPADLFRAVAHEVVGLELLPQGQCSLIGDTKLMQQLERLALIFPDPQLQIR